MGPAVARICAATSVPCTTSCTPLHVTILFVGCPEMYPSTPSLFQNARHPQHTTVFVTLAALLRSALL